MAKVKSIKFYNFVGNGMCGCLNVKFYNIIGKLINMDFSNPISTPTTTYCETPEYIVTSNSSESSLSMYNYQAFHTGNCDKTVNTKVLGYTWAPIPTRFDSKSQIKIEFKIPLYLSNIRINHTYSSTNFFNSCDYDVQYDDDTIETHSYISNGSAAPYAYTAVAAGNYDQEVYDSYFDSIKFAKSKQIYDSKIGYTETLDTNNFRNIPINSIETLKVLYEKPLSTILNCIVSFDKKQTWKTFDGSNWNVVSDTSESNIIINCMDVGVLNILNKNQLISGGFTGDLDFKIVMKTNDINKTPSITKIYIEYK